MSRNGRFRNIRELEADATCPGPLPGRRESTAKLAVPLQPHPTLYGAGLPWPLLRTQCFRSNQEPDARLPAPWKNSHGEDGDAGRAALYLASH
jgi:hypothetical protein